MSIRQVNCTYVPEEDRVMFRFSTGAEELQEYRLWLTRAVLSQLLRHTQVLAVEAVKAGGFGRREVVIRVNGLDTPWGAEDLAAVAEAALEAVVMGRVMARRDDHAGMGAEVADREAQLRRRTRAGEEVGLAAEFAPGAGDELGEVAGEVADVMGDDEAGAGLGRGDMLPEADDRAEHVDVVEAGRTDGGADRQALGVDFVGCGDPADRPAAHAAGTEGDALVESVLDFRPGAPVAQVLQGIDRGGRQSPGAEPIPGVGEAGGGDLPLALGGLEERKDGGGSAHESAHTCPPGGGDKPVGGGGGG